MRVPILAMRITDPTGRLRAATWEHPRIYLALKAALAATLAWLAVLPLGDLGAKYSYYAPLGALTAMTTAVITSIRTTVQSVVAITLGGALALTIDLLPVPRPLGLAVALGVAVLVGGWRRLGTMGSWVPFAALFVLIAGAGEETQYTAAYAGLTALGAAVGVALNLLLPQFPLAPAARVQEQLRSEIGDQMDRLASCLEREMADEHDWAALRRTLARRAAEAETLIAQAREARRGNWSARRWAERADLRDRRARALQRLSGIADEVIALVSDQRTDIRRDDPDSAELRAGIAGGLRAVARLIRETGEDQPDPDVVEEANQAVERLRADVVRTQQRSSLPHLAAAAIALDLEQAVTAWC